MKICDRVRMFYPALWDLGILSFFSEEIPKSRNEQLQTNN